MLSNKFIFLFLFKFIWCDKSLTIVLDTTRSMRDDLDIIKANIHTAVSSGSNEFVDYILVPFNEDVREPVVTSSPRDLITAINRLYVSGGQTCPENSLAGIKRALEVSKPQSNIFVFTDAYAKDVEKLAAIENLCRSTRSQVVIFLTNSCLSSTVTAQVYYDVTRACSGMVFRLDIFNLRQVFKYINEIIKVEWTDVTPYVISEYKEFSFSVDSFTKSVLMAVSGEYPIVVFSPSINSTTTFETIMDSRNTQVIRLLDTSPGEHRVAIRCEGTTSVVLYKKSQLPLRIGFSTQLPKSLKETSRRPLPGRISNILIEVSETTKLETISIQTYNNQEKRQLELEEIPNSNFYLTKTFIEPDKSFIFWFKGYDKITYEKIEGSTTSIMPQVTVIDPRWTVPKAQILEEAPFLVEYGKNVKIACKVAAYPQPTVWWRDASGSTLSTSSETALLELPSLFISYVNIDNVMTNLTLYCNSKNSNGEDSQVLDVYVYRPFTFEVLETPSDQTIEYGTDAKLYCQVKAYPDAETKWYHNGSLVTPSEDIEILPEENALYLKRMTLDTVGEYKCQVSNEVDTKSYAAQITISGIEAPQVTVEKSNIVLKLGDWTTIECTIVKGKPLPELTWTYKSKDTFDFGALPENVVVEDGKLKIASAQVEHAGTFKCNAQNIEGQNSADVTITVQQPPTISNSESHSMVVKEDDDVELVCDVTASPAAKVHWEMSQDDVIVQFDDRHRTDEDHTHKFKALGKDSGNYHCIAENEIGRAEKTININVLVKPYIEAPKPSVMNVRAGDNISLTCNVVFGNPVPSTKWEFTALDSTVKTLKRGNSSSTLYLYDVRHTNEGSYMCIAVNDVGTDNIKIDVKVQ